MDFMPRDEEVVTASETLAGNIQDLEVAIGDVCLELDRLCDEHAALTDQITDRFRLLASLERELAEAQAALAAARLS